MKEKYTNLEFDVIKKAVANHCSFSLGKEYILNEEVHFTLLRVNRELQRGKEALALYESYRSPSLGGVSDITNSIQLIDKGGVVATQQLFQIAQFSRVCASVKNYMQASTLNTPAMEDIVSSLSIQRKIVDEIETCISAAYEIKDSASSELKSIRRLISNTEQELVKVTQEVMSKYASILMENITATRNGRTCVLVKASDKGKIRGFVHGESASGQAVYIEPEVLLKLNNTLQSLLAKEKEEEMRIIRELCTLVMGECHAYYSDVDTITLIDALFAKAKWAFDHCGCYASIKEDENTLYLKDARHPLIEDEKVVANTYTLQAPYRHLLITGSNTGGKTVTLKTIGLFAVLTYAGFPILCEEAIFPYLDGIYVDIGDSQSIMESLSTFSAHVSKLASITQQASEHSLVLLDELGSGTDPQEGECLAIATLDYFREHQIMCIATTHYSKLKEYAKQKDDILLASLTFDMEKLCPTYRYLEGYSGQSNALEIAARYHLDTTIIAKAQLLKEENKSDEQHLMENLEKDRITLVQESEKIKALQEQLAQQEESFNQAKESFMIEKEKIEAKANEKATRIIEEAKEQADNVIEQLKQLQLQAKEHEMIAIKSQLNKEEEEVEEESEHVFKEKEYVRIKTLGYHGEILSIKGNRATVFANGMKMNVKTNELEYTQRPVVKKVAHHSSKRVSNKNITGECNLIGMHVEEALSVVDKYIDSALFSKMYNLRVIHGHGTGALRKAVHAYLKNNKHVESYRLGGEGEGGLGATVVQLKHGAKNG